MLRHRDLGTENFADYPACFFFSVSLIHDIKVDKNYTFEFSQRSCDEEVQYFS